MNIDMFYCKFCQKAIPIHSEQLVLIPQTKVGVYSAYHKDCIDKRLSEREKE